MRIVGKKTNISLFPVDIYTNKLTFVSFFLFFCTFPLEEYYTFSILSGIVASAAKQDYVRMFSVRVRLEEEKKKIALFRAQTFKSALSSHRQKSRPEFEIEVKTGDKIFSLPTFGKSGLLSQLHIWILFTKLI